MVAASMSGTLERIENSPQMATIMRVTAEVMAEESTKENTSPLALETVENQCAITKEFVVNKRGFEDIENMVHALIQYSIKEKDRNLVNFSISGYENDPRELYEIPEVCEYSKELNKRIPELFSMLTLESAKRFVGWLCGPTKKHEISSPEFRSKYNEMLKECLGSWNKANESLRKQGATDSFVKSVAESDFDRMSTLSIMVVRGV